MWTGVRFVIEVGTAAGAIKSWPNGQRGQNRKTALELISDMKEESEVHVEVTIYCHPDETAGVHVY